jgi:hypothetical protein
MGSKKDMPMMGRERVAYFSELSKLKLHGTRDLLHYFVLSGRSDTGHRDTDGDSRALLENKCKGEKVTIVRA